MELIRKLKDYAMALLLVAAVIYIIFLQECQRPEPCPECPEITTEVQIDSVPYPVEVRVPEIIYQDTGSTEYITKWREKEIDTNEFIKACEDLFKEYYTTNYYEDILVDDTNAKIIVKDSVSQNKIIHRSFIFTPYVRKHTTTVTLVERRREIYIGAGIGRSPTSFGFAPSVMYISKKRNAYSAMYDVLNGDFYFTMYWCINKGKRKK